MKTKHLDNEIERLNLMERTKDLSEYGQDMLNEFKAIKQALTIPVVVGRSEQLKAFREWTRENLNQEDVVTQKAVDGYLESL